MDPFASALEQAAAVRRREVSARELVDAYLERIERLNPRLNAYWLTTPELAREQADHVGTDGPLAGAPTSVKDLVAMAGYPLTFGSRAFEDQVASVDAFLVTRMKAAGAPILGRTTTPEFGSRPVTEFGLHGTTRNPWNLDRTPGGSSGGAGAALAAGLCAWAHGTDGGGSVRIPASCCGLVGLKPSRGRISPGPLVGEGWAGLSTQGVLARTVDDAAAGLDTLAGHLPGDPYWSEPEGSYLRDRPAPGRLRIGFQATADCEIHAEIQELVRRTARTLEELGHHVEEAGPDTGPLRPAMRTVVTAGTASYPVADPSVLDPLNAAMKEAARHLTAADYVTAVNTIRNHSRVVVAFWDEHDLLLTPTLTQPPYPIGAFAGAGAEMTQTLEWITFTSPYNCTGQPAITLPLGTSADGLPLGVQLVGAPRGEMLMLAVAAQLEEAMPWGDRRPPDFA
ncbi:MAG TPA: amidase [Candidatus Dormibacteraeota bacterium]|nr:amidase [Candidatus Dormibacteraeota bacterium]